MTHQTAWRVFFSFLPQTQRSRRRLLTLKEKEEEEKGAAPVMSRVFERT